MPMRPGDLEVTHRSVTLRGIRMHYVEKGSGPLAVLLHGFPENWWSWRYQIDPLVRAGYRVIAPDQRGYNETDAIGPYDVDTLSDDIRALIEHAGERRATVISHDWGGAVGWRFASRHGDATERLVVMNCPHLACMREALLTKPSQIRKSWYMFFFQLPWLPERAITRNGGEGVYRSLRSLAVDPTNFSRDEMQPFMDGVLRPGRATAMIDWYRASVRAGFRPNETLSKSHSRVECPTLLLWAMEDRALGYDDLVPGTARYVPNLEIRRIENCGHFVQQERPEIVNDALLEWLGQARSRS